VIAVESATVAAQFGMAGLIAWMWLSERRSALARERQIERAHELLVAERASTSALLGVVESNTRALATLESSQRELSSSLRALLGVMAGDGRGAVGGAVGGDGPGGRARGRAGSASGSAE